MNTMLVKLQEECAEVIHISAKIHRFGWENWNPNDKHRTPNHRLLRNELMQLNALMGKTIQYLKRYSGDGD